VHNHSLGKNLRFFNTHFFLSLQLPPSLSIFVLIPRILVFSRCVVVSFPLGPLTPSSGAEVLSHEPPLIFPPSSFLLFVFIDVSWFGYALPDQVSLTSVRIPFFVGFFFFLLGGLAGEVYWVGRHITKPPLTNRLPLLNVPVFPLVLFPSFFRLLSFLPFCPHSFIRDYSLEGAARSQRPHPKLLLHAMHPCQ